VFGAEFEEFVWIDFGSMGLKQRFELSLIPKFIYLSRVKLNSIQE